MADVDDWITPGMPSNEAAVPPAPNAAPADDWITPTQQTSTATHESVPFSESVAHGIIDPVIGAAQLISKAGGSWGDPELAQQFSFSPTAPIPMMSPEETQSAIAKQEKDYQAQRTAAGQTGPDVGRLVGDIISPTNYLVPGGATGNIISRLGKAALTGATMAGSMPAYGDDFWSQKATQMGLGAGVGAIGQAVTGALLPQATADAQQLMSQGVPLTPGQQVGGLPRRFEEAMKSWPVLGSFIRSAEGRGTEGFNRSLIDQTLEPVGDALPKNVPIGHDAISYAQDSLSKKYNDLLPNLTFQADEPFMKGMQDLGTTVSEMPAPQQAQFSKIIQNRFVDRLDPGGTMDGQTIKTVESELGHQANQYRGSPDPTQRSLGYSIGNVQSLMRDALARNNPEHAADLQNINSAYAMLTRVEGAATRRAGSEGVITPSDLLQAIRNADSSARHRQFAAGDSLLQEYAEAANRVLPSRMPDSGTAERGFWAMLAGDTLGGLLAGSGMAGESAAAYIPTLAKVAGGTMLFGLPYTKAAPLVNWVPSAARAGIANLPTPVGGIVGSQ